MAPRSLASSSLKSDTKVNSLQAEDMYIRRPQHDQSGSTCSQKARFPRASADENSATSKPRLEGFCRGSWWDVDIVQQRDKYFLAKFLSPLTGEEDAWLPLNNLRLKNRKSDDWDCNLLKRGMDVSVMCTHPDQKELKLHSRALYDAKIVHIAKATHKFECTCKFHVRFYCVSTEDPIGLTRERLLLNHPSASRDVTISTVTILQQPGIVPFYEILKSHLSKKWIQAGRWSNDAFFLRETKLNLHVPPDCGENRLYDDDEDDGLDEALLATGATRLDKPEAFTYSFRVQHSREQATKENPVDQDRPYANFREPPDPPQKNRGDHFTVTAGDPGVKDNSASEPDICSVGVLPESRGVKPVFDKEIPQTVRSGVKRARDDIPHLSKNPQEASVKQVKKKSTSQPNEGRELYEREVYRRCNENRQSSEISSDKGNFEDEMVDIGGGSSDEDDLSIQAPAKTSYGINPQNSGGRCDNAVQNQGHPYPPLSKTIESKRLRRSRRRCDDALQNQDSAYSPPLKKVDGKNLRTSGRRVDDAGQKQGRLYTPPVTTNDGKSLHTSGRRSDEGLRKRGRPRQNAEGSPTKIKPDAGFKSTNQADISGVSLATKEDEDVDCEILETDPTIMARLTEQSKSLKGRQEKTEVCIDNETFDKPKNPLSRLRPRNSGKKQTFGTGGNIPGSHRQPVLKPTLGKEGGQVPLYMDLLVDNLVPENETEEQVDDISKGQGQAKKPKCGMNEDWDPTSFKYDIPTLEEKQAELQQQQQQEQEEEEDEEEEQQEKPPIADCPSDLMEREADEEVVTLDVDPEGEGSLCKEHNLYLKEDVGMICKSCALVVISIENLVPSLGIRQPRHCGEASDWDAGTKSPDHFQETAEYQKLQAEKDVTWMSSCKLPPRIQNSMHPHQKDGFAFLWRNLAIGEGNNRTMREDRNTGCILSHAPGTGKTFLVIAFLQSYINNFPTCRPLIVAPKIMLRQWEKEFERWKSDISVYILNTARESGKRLLQMHEDAGVINSKNLHLSSKRLLDTFRLAMLYEWSKNRSVIIVSYNLFACLTDENRDHLSPEGEAVRKTLLEKPSLLILDEGHFPRNKGTRIRKSLMSVKTNVRILLSGTLFQNNFEELFNTLYLVRPGFVEGFASFVPNCTDEDGQSNVKKFSDIEDVTKEAEKIARKLFVEEVGLKIEQGQSSKARSDDLDYGLERLGALTTEFVHHHTGGVLEALPGLRDFAVILKPTQQQSSILELLQKYFHKPNQYLEREIAVSQTSIHPILVNTLEFTRSLGIFNDFREQKLGASAGSGSVTGPASGLSKKEAKDPSDGVKTKFVFDLLCYSKPAKEKVLIFSQHLTPLELLAEMFVTQFRWRETYEYLKLDGQLSLDERAKIIEKFNNPSSEACVLLASTKACGEGVSLIGASRVVFLDVLWNPAVIKQAMSRAFRLGQKKIVYVYRLIASGTIEEHKYKKAIRKDWLSRSIFSASQGEGLKASEINREVRKSLGIIDDKGEDIKPSGATIFAKAAQEQEVLDANHATGVTRSVEQGDEGVHRLRKIQELLAWEVDVAICKDVMLEKILGKDKVERKTFLKVIEHGSDFRDENIPFGPDAREWFLEGMEDNEPLDMKEVNDEAYPAILSDSDEDDM